MKPKIYAALRLVMVMVVIASGFAFASEMAPWTLFNSNGGVAAGFDANGTLLQPQVGQNSGTVAGSAASTYTITFTTAEPNTNYKMLLQPTGTATSTNIQLFVTTKATTSCVVTPAVAGGFTSAVSFDWFKVRN